MRIYILSLFFFVFLCSCAQNPAFIRENELGELSFEESYSLRELEQKVLDKKAEKEKQKENWLLATQALKNYQKEVPAAKADSKLEDLELQESKAKLLFEIKEQEMFLAIAELEEFKASLLAQKKGFNDADYKKNTERQRKKLQSLKEKLEKKEN